MFSLYMSSIRLLFIVPYRNREFQQEFFDRHMRDVILADIDISSYELLYVHQRDERTFNRGALKNIGFLYAKQKYPDTYQSISLVFNDVDSIPFRKNQFQYETTSGTIKHFFGFRHTLGGILSVTGADFERMGGFPNFWGWGYEDNELERRAAFCRIVVDRSQFVPLFDACIIQYANAVTGNQTKRTVQRKEIERYFDLTTEGWRDIYDIVWTYNVSTSFLDVFYFRTPSPDMKSDNEEISLSPTQDIVKHFKLEVKARLFQKKIKQMHSSV